MRYVRNHLYWCGLGFQQVIFGHRVRLAQEKDFQLQINSKDSRLLILLQDYQNQKSIVCCFPFRNNFAEMNINNLQRYHMKQSRLDDWTQFVECQRQRNTMKLSPKIDAMMDHCEYVIHSQFDKNTKSKNKHKKRKQELTNQYQQAFKSLNRDEKLQYYLRFMKLVTDYMEGMGNVPVSQKGIFSTDVYSRSHNLKMWKHKKLRLDKQKHILYAEKDNKIKTYLLQDYILRKSKNKQYYSFVLEAVNDKPHQKSRTVHLGFKQQSKYNLWMQELLFAYDVIDRNFIISELKDRANRTMTESDVLSRSELASERNKSYLVEDFEQVLSRSEIIQVKQEKKLKKQQIKPEDRVQPKIEEKQQIKKSISPEKIVKNEEIIKQQAIQQQEQNEQFFSQEDSEEQNVEKKGTIIESIAKIDDLDEIQEITRLDQTRIITEQAKQNIFQRIMPQYRLQDLYNTVNYGSLHDDGVIRILGHLEHSSKIKLLLSFPSNIEQKVILNCLTSQTIKEVNPQIQEISLKTMIKSENSAMVYLKIKAYNKLYRPRDFIFLRHAFSAYETVYLIDKSIQNVSFPPFTTIVRGQLSFLWGIRRQADRTSLICDINMNNQGYLNESQNVNLILKYLKGFVNMQRVLKEKQHLLLNISIFQEKWNIVQEQRQEIIERKTKTQKSAEKKENEGFKKKKRAQKVQPKQSEKKKEQTSEQNNKNKKVAEQEKKKVVQKEEIKQQKKQASKGQNQMPTKSISLKEKYSHMQQEKGEIDLKQMEKFEKQKSMTVSKIKRQFNAEGFVIISNKFTRTRYVLAPLPKKQTSFQEPINGHPIWKGDWIHDDKVGAIKFINQKKIQDQKGVLKFILGKIGQNIVSGKSILNISLPVDIFCGESNLQRLVYSLTYAPTHLEPAVKYKNNPIQRLKKLVAFGISNSPLYLNMQKPFNPILGETFQCWIDGCPVYAEQISHHPPIAAIFYEGRGFRMTAQLQSKVQLHMNSGCGTNDGIFQIKFDDGMEACYITPGGEVSGLAYGDRKFNMVGKSYYWIQSQLLFLEIVFNPTKKGFFSVGKQEQPIDYLEGTICKVKPEFLEQFRKKRRGPNEKQIIEKFGKIHGIWNKFILYENETILDIDKQFPAQLQYEANPLPSDANWRQDITYRRMYEVSRAQSQKERLEVLQRKDRKLRQAHHPHKHKK